MRLYFRSTFFAHVFHNRVFENSLENSKQILAIYLISGSILNSSHFVAVSWQYQSQNHKVRN